MTHLEGNFYPNVILPTSPPTVPLTTHHYLSSGARQHKIIGVTNSCFFLLLFPGEIMLNIFFIDLLINRESEFLKGLCWTNPDVIGVTDAFYWGAARAGGKIPEAETAQQTPLAAPCPMG